MRKLEIWAYLNGGKLLKWSILIWAISTLLLIKMHIDVTGGEMPCMTILITFCAIIVTMVCADSASDLRHAVDETIDIARDERYDERCQEFITTLKELLNDYESQPDYDYMKETVEMMEELVAIGASIDRIEDMYNRTRKLLLWSENDYRKTVDTCKNILEQAQQSVPEPVVEEDVSEPVDSNLKNLEMESDKMGKIKGRKPNYAQKQALLNSGIKDDDINLYLYQKDVTKQANGSNNLNSHIEKITYWQFVNRETGELTFIPSTR